MVYRIIMRLHKKCCRFNLINLINLITPCALFSPIFLQTCSNKLPLDTVTQSIPWKPILEPNIKWIGWPVAEIWPLKVFHVVSNMTVGLGDIVVTLLPHYVTLYRIHLSVGIGVGDGRHVPPPQEKNGEKIFFGQLLCKIRAFSGKNHVKFRNFVNFSGKFHKN